LTHPAATVTSAPAVPPSLKGMLRIWSVYGFGSIVSRSIAFLLLPLYTRVLSPEEYGIRAMVGLALELTLLLVACGMKEATTRFYLGAQTTGGTRPDAGSTGILLHGALIGLGIVAGLLLAPWIAGPLLGDAALAPYLRLGLVAGFFMHLHEGAFVYFRARGRAGLVVASSLATLVGMVALNPLFVVAFRWGVAGIFYSEIIVFGVSGIAFTALALRELGVTFRPALARAMVRFGAPIMFMPLTWLVLTRTDMMFLTHYGSLAHVGVYVLAVQCAQVLALAVVYPFRNVWDPMQFQLGDDAAGRRMFRRMFQWVTFFAIVAAFGCAIAAADVITVMAAPAFHAAAAVVPILVLVYVFEVMHVMVNSALLVRNRTTLVVAVAVVTVGVNLAANALLVPRFMATGAAISRVLAMVAMVSVTFALAQRLRRQEPNVRALAAVSGWAIALFVVAQALPELPLPATVAVKGLLVVALITLSLWSGALDREDLRHVWGLVRARLRPVFGGRLKRVGGMP
jgi:O-antigen/teichoic acid export membrane protein